MSLRVNQIEVLAASSGGGHWEELMLLRSAVDAVEARFATPDPLMAQHSGIANPERLPDCNQKQPLRSLHCFFVAFRIVLRLRPKVVISTGAAPGFFCILAGRLLGAHTLWIDSVANGEELSMCGKLAKVVAHECWTQWEHLSDGTRVQYRGAVL